MRLKIKRHLLVRNSRSIRSISGLERCGESKNIYSFIMSGNFQRTTIFNDDVVVLLNRFAIYTS
jgi:hypothetical protein